MAVKKCTVCGKDFEVAKAGKYCSIECRKAARNARERADWERKKQTSHTCAICGKAFLGTPKQKYCSQECRAQALSKSASRYHSLQAAKEREALEATKVRVTTPPRNRLERNALAATQAGMSYGSYMARKMFGG